MTNDEPNYIPRFVDLLLQGPGPMLGCVAVTVVEPETGDTMSAEGDFWFDGENVQLHARNGINVFVLLDAALDEFRPGVVAIYSTLDDRHRINAYHWRLDFGEVSPLPVAEVLNTIGVPSGRALLADAWPVEIW